MVGAVYEPTSTEWIALLAFLVSAATAAFTFVFAALAFHWRIYYKRRDIYHPPFFIPELYSLLRVLCILLIGVGTWMAWREAARAESGVPEDPEEPDPTQGDFFKSMLFYIIFLGLEGGFGLSFFHIGLSLGWFGFPVLLELGALAMAVTLTVYAWLIWWLPGMLILIGTVFVLYSVIMMALYWLYGAVAFETFYLNPVEGMYENMMMMPQPQELVAMQKQSSGTGGRDSMYPSNTSASRHYISARQPMNRQATATTASAPAPAPVSSEPIAQAPNTVTTMTRLEYNTQVTAASHHVPSPNLVTVKFPMNNDKTE